MTEVAGKEDGNSTGDGMKSVIEMIEGLVSQTRELVGYGKTVLQCLQVGTPTCKVCIIL
jgi:hypothetical protein